MKIEDSRRSGVLPNLFIGSTYELTDEDEIHLQTCHRPVAEGDIDKFSLNELLRRTQSERKARSEVKHDFYH